MMKRISTQQLKRYWDFVTLGKFRWCILSGWIIGWILPQIIFYTPRIPNVTLTYNKSLYFVLRYLEYYSDYFKTHYPYYLVYTWGSSSLHYWTGISLAAIIIFLFSVAQEKLKVEAG